jgi:hypothetical protein
MFGLDRRSGRNHVPSDPDLRMFLLRMKVKGAWTNCLRFGMVVVVRVTAS